MGERVGVMIYSIWGGGKIRERAILERGLG